MRAQRTQERLGMLGGGGGRAQEGLGVPRGIGGGTHLSASCPTSAFSSRSRAGPGASPRAERAPPEGRASVGPPELSMGSARGSGGGARPSPCPRIRALGRDWGGCQGGWGTPGTPHHPKPLKSFHPQTPPEMPPDPYTAPQTPLSPPNFFKTHPPKHPQAPHTPVYPPDVPQDPPKALCTPQTPLYPPRTLSRTPKPLCTLRAPLGPPLHSPLKTPLNPCILPQFLRP